MTFTTSLVTAVGIAHLHASFEKVPADSVVCRVEPLPNARQRQPLLVEADRFVDFLVCNTKRPSGRNAVALQNAGDGLSGHAKTLTERGEGTTRLIGYDQGLRLVALDLLGCARDWCGLSLYRWCFGAWQAGRKVP